MSSESVSRKSLAFEPESEAKGDCTEESMGHKPQGILRANPPHTWSDFSCTTSQRARAFRIGERQDSEATVDASSTWSSLVFFTSVCTFLKALSSAKFSDVYRSFLWSATSCLSSFS